MAQNLKQVELEMQNTELQEARDRMEAMVEKYTDLYDFAPVGIPLTVAGILYVALVGRRQLPGESPIERTLAPTNPSRSFFAM